MLEKWFYFGRSKRKPPAQKQDTRAQGAKAQGARAQDARAQGARAQGAKAQGEEIARLRKENQVLRDTLLFYANAKNWDSGYKYRDPDDATIFVDSSESGISVDKGERARQVLTSLTKEKQQE